jgi:endonuclease III
MFFRTNYALRGDLKMNENAVSLLIKRGQELLSTPYELLPFTKNKESDCLLNDLVNYPHAFVLACVMDRQIKAERAWLIPYEVSKEIGGFEFEKLMTLSIQDLKDIFNKKNLHRFNNMMAEMFYSAVQLLNAKYGGLASRIWSDKPGSAAVVSRFREFKGVGPKIATMAANCLVREFKVSIGDTNAIDISPDVHVMRVFTRLGLLSPNASEQELIYTAKRLFPQYPGVFDLPAWWIGRDWCKPTDPLCSYCYLSNHCPKIIVV